jgi:hypothetical protein
LASCGRAVAQEVSVGNVQGFAHRAAYLGFLYGKATLEEEALEDLNREGLQGRGVEAPVG